jgi:acid-sensing ion channel 5
MAEISLDSKEFDDTLKDDGKNQTKLQLKQENENEKKKSNLQKYAENNSVGGLSFVLSSKSRIRRLIWLIIILVCVAISLYLVRNTFSKLFNRPTSTTITNDPNLSLEFPAVTICNVNGLSRRLLWNHGINPDRLSVENDPSYEGNYADYEYDPTNQGNDTNYEWKDPILSANLADNDIKKFILECSFPNQLFCEFEFSLNDLFACYTFNSGRSGKPIKKVTGTGANDGLTLLININQDDYSETPKRDAGIKILLHPQDEPPHPERFGVAASPGTNMYIGFKKQVYDDQTMRSCFSKSQHKWMYLSEEIPYSYASCLKDGSINASLTECECVLSTDDLSSNEHPLCTYTQLSCYSVTRFIPLEPCKPACKHTTFEILSATHTTYPANYVKGSDSIYNTANDAKYLSSNDSISVSVYYETLNVQTQMTVFSYGIEEFFAEVGGQLGLFIGVSVITLFEFVIFLADELKNRMKKRLRKISK